MERIKQFKRNNLPNLLYMDQNHWSKLVRVHHKIEEDSVIEDLLSKILELKENGTLRIVIDINRKIETSQRDIDESRKRLTDFMLTISDKYFVLPSLVLEEFEIKNYFSRKLGTIEYDILDLAIGKEFKHLMVGEPSISSDEIEKKELDIINKKIHELIQNSEFIKGIFYKYSKKDEDNRLKYIEDAENVRKILYTIETDRRRRKYQTTQDFKYLMRKIMETYRLTDDFAGEISDFDKAIYLLMIRNCIPKELTSFKDRLEFIKEFPLHYTHCTLIDFRDRDLKRKIQANDLIDIVSYVLPIVYFNVVVGERYFINLAHQAKLDEEYGTTLISRLSELKDYLEQLDSK